MKHISTKIFLSIGALIILSLTMVWLINHRGATESGTIQIRVIDAQGAIIIDDMIDYDVTDEDGNKTTMHMILSSQYDIEVRNGFLVRIESVEADGRDYFIKILINCIPSNYGIDQMKFKNGDVISFVYARVGGTNDAC